MNAGSGRPPVPRLPVSSRGDFCHDLSVDGVAVTVVQRRHLPLRGYEVLELEILAPSDVRFAFDVLVPPEAINACMTLGDDALLDWFDEKVPDEVAALLPERLPGCTCDSCAEAQGRRFSPLAPGRVQALVFRWHPGDVLRMHLLIP
jgi:hypothetical protein